MLPSVRARVCVPVLAGMFVPHTYRGAHPRPPDRSDHTAISETVLLAKEENRLVRSPSWGGGRYVTQSTSNPPLYHGIFTFIPLQLLGTCMYLRAKNRGTCSFLRDRGGGLGHWETPHNAWMRALPCMHPLFGGRRRLLVMGTGTKTSWPPPRTSYLCQRVGGVPLTPVLLVLFGAVKKKKKNSSTSSAEPLLLSFGPQYIYTTLTFTLTSIHFCLN